MTTAVYCDQCNRTRPVVAVGWMHLTLEDVGATFGDDVSDKDFCSYPCLAKYAEGVMEQSR
jgi:hypothetical protein